MAFWYGSGYRGVFTTATTGYDPAYTNLRVGTYVLMKLVEDLCADPTVDVLDFGFGDADYKRRFGQESWAETDVFAFAARPRPIAVNLARSAIVGAGEVATSVVAPGLTDRVKKAWRSRPCTIQLKPGTCFRRESAVRAQKAWVIRSVEALVPSGMPGSPDMRCLPGAG